MKKLLRTTALIFLTTFAAGTINAQSWPWAKSGIVANSPYAGGEGYGVSTDPSGNIFITGCFLGDTLMFGPNILLGNDTIRTMYIAKYNPSGNVLWARQSIGTVNGGTNSVSTDSNGNCYVSGSFDSPTVVFGSQTLSLGSDMHRVFITKYDASGNALWAKNAIGDVYPYGNTLTTDANGNSYLTGAYTGSTIIFGTHTLTNSGGQSVFLAKYDTIGNVLWARSSNGASSNAYGSSVSTDINGNVFLTGVYLSSTITFGSYTLTNIGSSNAFLTKYDSNGNVLWAKTSIGSGYDIGRGVCTDANGDVYITGSFDSPTISFGTYTLTNSPPGSLNVFLTKYNSVGNVLWAKNSKGSLNIGYSICSDASNIYMTGSLLDTLVIDTYTFTQIPSIDRMFIARYDFNGNANYACTLSSGGDDANAICVDKLCSAYITGDFLGTPFIIGTNTISTPGGECPFVAKLSFSTNCQPESIQTSNSISQPLIFPNPNNGSFKIQMDNEIENGELILLNALGQIVRHQKISKGGNDINASEILSGLYQYIILNNRERINAGKLIIE